MSAVPPPLSDDRWEDQIPTAGYALPFDDLVRHVMEMFGKSKPDAEALVDEVGRERVQTLIDRRWNATDGDWRGVA